MNTCLFNVPTSDENKAVYVCVYVARLHKNQKVRQLNDVFYSYPRTQGFPFKRRTTLRRVNKALNNE